MNDLICPPGMVSHREWHIRILPFSIWGNCSLDRLSDFYPPSGLMSRHWNLGRYCIWGTCATSIANEGESGKRRLKRETDMGLWYWAWVSMGPRVNSSKIKKGKWVDPLVELSYLRERRPKMFFSIIKIFYCSIIAYYWSYHFLLAIVFPPPNPSTTVLQSSPQHPISVFSVFNYFQHVSEIVSSQNGLISLLDCFYSTYEWDHGISVFYYLTHFT